MELPHKRIWDTAFLIWQLPRHKGPRGISVRGDIELCHLPYMVIFEFEFLKFPNINSENRPLEYVHEVKTSQGHPVYF